MKQKIEISTCFVGPNGAIDATLVDGTRRILRQGEGPREAPGSAIYQNIVDDGELDLTEDV